MNSDPIITSAPARAAQIQGIEIIPLSDRLWKVRIVLPSADVGDPQLVTQMRQAKQMIAAQFTVPLELMEFREILSKEETAAGIILSITVGLLEVGKGRTTVRLKPLEAPSGAVFEDMIAEVDFYYLDEFDRIISRDGLLAAFEKKGLAPDLINYHAAERALQKVIHERSGVTHLEVARGKLPDQGTDAQLEYTFFAEPRAALDLSEYHASRKVKAGDLLCQKIPPKDGRYAGISVLGASVPPLRGLDFQLIAGDGARISLDGTRVTATRDGLAVMNRTLKKVCTPAGTRVVPTQIMVTVKELLTITGDQATNVNADSSVEIRGNVKEGSSISARGEIILSGNVEHGAQISATSDVLIQGRVSGAQIVSEASVIGNQKVENSTISAESSIELHGAAENSDLTADYISVLESLGSRLQAHKKVLLRRASSDASGRRTTIRLNKNHFYASKLEAEMQEIDAISASLAKLKEFFGAETWIRTARENPQRLMLAELKRLRNTGHQRLTAPQVHALKMLLEAINPLRLVLAEKNEEYRTLLQKADEEDAERPVVLIHEKICDPVDIAVADATHTLNPTETGLVVTATNDGQIETQPLPADSPPLTQKP